jgi:hypothetical protein
MRVNLDDHVDKACSAASSVQCRQPVPTVWNREAADICTVGAAVAPVGTLPCAARRVLIVCTALDIIILGVRFADDSPDSQVRHN